MARPIDPQSVGNQVALLELNGTLEVVNRPTSVAVMVSNLKKKEKHKDKIFKIKSQGGNTIVTRIK